MDKAINVWKKAMTTTSQIIWDAKISNMTLPELLDLFPEAADAWDEAHRMCETHLRHLSDHDMAVALDSLSRCGDTQRIEDAIRAGGE